MALIVLFGIPGVILTFWGARLVFSISPTLLSQILGGFLVTYVLYLFLKPAFQFKQNVLTALAGGALSGFFAGIFGVGGTIRGMILSAFYLPKEVFLATIGVIGLYVDLTRLITYVWQGTRLTEELSWGLLFFIPASFVGARLAKKIVDQIPQKQFRLIIAVFLFLIGLKLFIFPS